MPQPQTQPSKSAPRQAPQTSQAQARQAAPPSPSPQDQAAPPRPAQRQDKSQERAPARAVPGAQPGEGRANPFADRATRRAAAMDSLRTQRGQGGGDRVEAPPASAEVRNAQAAQNGPDGPGGATTPPDQATEGQAALATLRAQHEEREARVTAAEAKVREAHTATEKRAAEAEAREAKAEAHLKRLEMLRGDPAQFLAEAGISEEEFKRYLATGGKPTGEQQRLSANERQMAEMRAEMDKVRAEAQAEVRALRQEREDAEFARELEKDDYTLVREMGGLSAVRAKQQSLRETLGKPVTLQEAAGQLEHEWDHGFKELLKRDKVRVKLGLDAREPAPREVVSEASKAPSPRTLNGSLSSATSHKGDSLAWNDWKGKRDQVLRNLARARSN